jgi:outer membrane murein-binding lipoprotein Lpp
MKYIITALVAGALSLGVMGCGKAELQKKDAELAKLTEQVTTLKAECDKVTADITAAKAECEALKAAAEATAKPAAKVVPPKKAKSVR